MSFFNRVYDASAVSEEIVTPQEYLKLRESDRENIKSAQIVPPKLGQKHFGKIKIIRKTPIYVIAE